MPQKFPLICYCIRSIRFQSLFLDNSFDFLLRLISQLHFADCGAMNGNPFPNHGNDPDRMFRLYHIHINGFSILRIQIEGEIP